MDSNFNFECLLLIGITIAVVTTVMYFNYFNREAQKASWKKFAKQHNLKFMPANWFGGGAFVHGRYRGYKVRLESFKIEKQMYTSIRISLNPAEKSAPIQQFEISDGEAAIERIIHWASSIKATYPEKTFKFKHRRFILEQAGLETNNKALEEIFDQMVDVANCYRRVVGLGGEATSFLRKKRIQDRNWGHLFNQLLKDISQETWLRLSYDMEHSYCGKCLTACSRIAIPLPLQIDIHYYGCRRCGQSREFIKASQVIAILDNQSQTEQHQQGDMLRVNWNARRELFDFDDIEIINATDEDVERFAVQVGNDTDPVRKPRYEKMHCFVSSACALSENSMRILARMFGEVVVGRNPV